MMPKYTIRKPAWPLTMWLLAGVMAAGVGALWLAAYHAFQQVMEPLQAVFAATLVEAGIIVEALTLVRSRSVFAGVAVVIGLVVSGTYNFIQAQSAGTLSNGWFLFVLALGPLASLVSMAMAFGNELRKWEEKVVEWEKKYQEWTDRESLKAQRAAAKRSDVRSPERSETRSETIKAERSPNEQVNETSSTIEKMNRIRTDKRTDKLNELVQYYQANPGASYSQAGRAVDRGKTWVAGAVPELVSAGRLVVNGHGVRAANNGS